LQANAKGTPVELTFPVNETTMKFSQVSLKSLAKKLEEQIQV
jgi:hypothetical protein